MSTQTREQRCLLTIAFADVCDSTLISYALDPEEFSLLMDEIRTEFTRIIEKHGGTVIRIVGDGVFFAFGYPHSYFNNTRRAIETLLDLHQHVQTLDWAGRGLKRPLKLHSGVHSGIVLVRSGTLSTGAYDMLGEAINVAAKLSGRAAPDEILISDEALGGDRHLFEVTAPRHMEVVENRPPLLCCTVLGRKPEQPSLVSRLEYQNTPFVGRSDAMASLQSFAFETPRTHRLALVHAEAGMGKSRLLYEFTQVLAQKDYAFHSGYCESYMGTLPLQPIRHILLSLITKQFGLTEQDLSSGVYPYLPEAKLIHDFIRHEIPAHDSAVERFAELILALSAERPGPSPTFLLIDDWQWADTASQRVVQALLNKDAGAISIILASRSVDVFLNDTTALKQISLSPLQREAIAETVETIHPTLDPFTKKKIQTISGGNPLFVEELCHALRHSRNLDESLTKGGWLAGLVNDRYAKLPKPLATIVQTAAAIGRTVPVWLLEAALGSTVSDTQLATLKQSDFLFPGDKAGTLKFKHGLTREAVYDTIKLSDRRMTHRKIADELLHHSLQSSAPELQGQLAYHYSQSGEREQTVKHAIRAGDHALASATLDSAQRFFAMAFQQIADLQTPDPRASRIIRQYGKSCVVDPSREQLTVLEAAVSWAASAGDTVALAWAEYWLASIYYGLGEPNRAISHFFSARQTAEQVSAKKLVSQIDASLGQAYVTACQHERAYEHLDRAIATKRTFRSGSRPSAGLSYALSCKAFALADQGEFDVAEQYFEDARTYMEGSTHEAMMSILAHEAASRLWMGQFEITEELYSQVIDMSVRMRSRYHHAMSTAIRAAARFYRTGDEAEVDQIAESTAWMVSSASQQYISLNFGFLADAYAQLGQWHKVRTYAARALWRARKGDRFGETISYRALALAASRTGDPAGCETYLAKAHASAIYRNSLRERQLLAYFQRELLQDHAPSKRALAVTSFQPHVFFSSSDKSQSDIRTMSEAGNA